MLSRFQKTTHTQQQVEDSTVAVSLLPAPSLGKAATLWGEERARRKNGSRADLPCWQALGSTAHRIVYRVLRGKGAPLEML